MKYLHLFGMIAFFGIVSPVSAATIDVTASAPDVLNGADGSCALREAIQNINNQATIYADCAPTTGTYGTADTIRLTAGTYTNTIANAGGTPESLNVSGDLNIAKSVSISGTGATTTIIDGNGALLSDRVLSSRSGITVHISGVTVQNGNSTSASGNGGGIHNRSTLIMSNSIVSQNTTTQRGGGIYNDSLGSLALSNSTISANTATFDGGGVYSLGDFTMTQSIIVGNTGFQEGGVAVYDFPSAPVKVFQIFDSTISGNNGFSGGGVNLLGGVLTISNSTVSGNAVTGNGGGMRNAGDSMTINNSTFSGNSSAWGSDNVYVNVFSTAAVTTVSNSLFDSTGPGCVLDAGIFNDNGYNIFSDATCGAAALTSMTNTNPLLGPLQNNGGPTFTHALLSGSPAKIGRAHV